MAYGDWPKGLGFFRTIRAVLAAPPVPFLISKRSQRRVAALIQRLPAGARILNVGAGSTRLGPTVINIDVFQSGTTDILASAMELPIATGSIDCCILQGLLDHVEDADSTVKECIRVLRPGGLAYAEMAFLQPYHESPIDNRRLTLRGLAQIFHPLAEVEAGIHIGPASAFAWMLRETSASLIGFGNDLVYRRASGLIGWLVFPIKYADHVLERLPALHTVASAFYFVGRKGS